MSSYLNEIAPDVFSAIPRPGGFTRIKGFQMPVSPKKNIAPFTKFLQVEDEKRTAKNEGNDLTCREFRLKKVLNSSPWAYMQVQELEGSLTPNPLNNSIDMLAITISTIMLLAVGHSKIPPDYLKWTYSYLELITDEFGHNPPNVMGIVNHIKKITGDQMQSFIEKPEIAAAQKGLRTSIVMKKNSQASKGSISKSADAIPAVQEDAEDTPADQ